MFVYRIEHAVSGDGPYVAHTDPKVITHAVQSALGYTQIDVCHPGMWSDCNFMDVPKDRLCSDYYCGFNSAEQMIAWFMLAFDTLDNAGFIIAVYDSIPDNILSGKYQISFVKNEAKRVDTITIPDMLVMA